MLKRWIFNLELRIDNFKSKKKLKRLNKMRGELQYIICVEMKRDSDELRKPFVDRYNNIEKLIKVEKMFMLDLK